MDLETSKDKGIKTKRESAAVPFFCTGDAHKPGTAGILAAGCNIVFMQFAFCYGGRGFGVLTNIERGDFR